MGGGRGNSRPPEVVVDFNILAAMLENLGCDHLISLYFFMYFTVLSVFFLYLFFFSSFFCSIFMYYSCISLYFSLLVAVMSIFALYLSVLSPFYLYFLYFLIFLYFSFFCLVVFFSLTFFPPPLTHRCIDFPVCCKSIGDESHADYFNPKINEFPGRVCVCVCALGKR